ncbi:MAG TPA: hypothetical protein VH797_10730 [Nitrososphaeraceae archaeon]|jgi:hypothetical protein
MQYTDSDKIAINLIIQKAHTDPEFRITLFKDTVTILNQFKISDSAKSLILSYFDEIKNPAD